MSQEQLIATWNIAAAERSANEIAESLTALEDRVGALDLLVLQEIVSEEQVEAAAEALGLPSFRASCASRNVKKPAPAAERRH